MPVHKLNPWGGGAFRCGPNGWPSCRFLYFIGTMAACYSGTAKMLERQFASSGCSPRAAQGHLKHVEDTELGELEFETTRQRAAREAEQAQEQEHRLDRLRLEQAYEEYLESETAKYIDGQISDGELAHATAQKKEWLRLQFKNMSPDQIDDLAHCAALTEIRRSVLVMEFDKFCRQHSGT